MILEEGRRNGWPEGVKTKLRNGEVIAVKLDGLKEISEFTDAIDRLERLKMSKTSSK